MQILPFGQSPFGSPYRSQRMQYASQYGSGMFAPQSPGGGNQMMPDGRQGSQPFANASEYDQAQPQPFQPPYMDGPNPDGSGGYRQPPQISGPNYMDGPTNGRGGYMPPPWQPTSQAPGRGGNQMMPDMGQGDGAPNAPGLMNNDLFNGGIQAPRYMDGAYNGGNKRGYGEAQYMTNGDAGRSPYSPTAGAQAPSDPSLGAMNQEMSGGAPKIAEAGMFAQQGQPSANNMFTGDTNAFNPNRSVSDIYSRYGVQDMVGHGGKWWNNAIQTGQAKGSDLEAALQREGFKNNMQRVPAAPPYNPPQIGPMPQGPQVPLAPQNMPRDLQPGGSANWWAASAHPQWQQILDARSGQWNPWASPWGK